MMTASGCSFSCSIISVLSSACRHAVSANVWAKYVMPALVMSCLSAKMIYMISYFADKGTNK